MQWMQSSLAFLQSLSSAEGYALVLGLLVASGFGLPVNEDLLFVFAAALTLHGVMQPVPLIAVCWLGLVVSDALVFYWGRRFGPEMLRHPLLARLMPEARLQAMQGTMRSHGPAYLFVARFMPWLRTPLIFAAGSLRTPWRHLLVYDGLAAMLQLPLMVYGVRYLGGRWNDILHGFHQFQAALLPGVALLAGVWWWRRRLRKPSAVDRESLRGEAGRR
jgi:membrane protein DedA with SNARE-associated domain